MNKLQLALLPLVLVNGGTAFAGLQLNLRVPPGIAKPLYVRIYVKDPEQHAHRAQLEAQRQALSFQLQGQLDSAPWNVSNGAVNSNHAMQSELSRQIEALQPITYVSGYLPPGEWSEIIGTLWEDPSVVKARPLRGRLEIQIQFRQPGSVLYHTSGNVTVSLDRAEPDRTAPFAFVLDGKTVTGDLRFATAPCGGQLPGVRASFSPRGH